MADVVASSLRFVRMALGLERPGSAAERRHTGLARGTLSALGAQGVAMAVALVTVPLAVRYLGAERYGAWMTIQSFLAWFTIADLGLGNQLTNVLSAAHGRGDERAAREAVASAFWMLAGVAAALLAAGAVVWWMVDWAGLLNVHSREGAAEVGPAIGLAFAIFLAGLPLAVPERVYTSLQEGATGNAWGIAANLATLAAIVAVVQTRGGLPWLVAATAGAGLLVRALSAAWLFARHKPHLRPSWGAVTRSSAAGLSTRGGEFFLVQIAALVLFSTDNIIIARVLGAEQVTPYSVTWRLLGLTNLLTTAAFPYLWAAYGEALARGDGAWVRATLGRSVAASAGVTALLLLPLTLLGETIIRIWAGPSAIPSRALLLWMAAWFLVNAPANAVAAFLNATGKVRVQVWTGLATAVVNVALSVILARSHGPTGVIAATVLSYAVLTVPPVAFETLRAARALKRGNAGLRPGPGAAVERE